VALAVIGFLVASPTLVGNFERVFAFHRDYTDAEITWSFEKSSLFSVYASALEQVRLARHTDVRALLASTEHNEEMRDARGFRVVNLWWWVLPVLNLPRALGAAVAALLMACAIALMISALRGPGPPPDEKFLVPL